MLKLTFDVTTGNLVPWQGSAATLPDFRQGVIPAQIYFVEPNPEAIFGSVNTSFAQYIAADLSAYSGVRIGLWNASTFANNDSEEAILALATDFTLNEDDADAPFFEGNFNLQTDEIGELEGKTASAYFTVVLVRGDLTLHPIYDQRGGANCTIFSATDDGFAAMPAASAQLSPIALPVRFIDEATGEKYELTRTGVGILSFVHTNP